MGYASRDRAANHRESIRPLAPGRVAPHSPCSILSAEGRPISRPVPTGFSAAPTVGKPSHAGPQQDADRPSLLLGATLCPGPVACAPVLPLNLCPAPLLPPCWPLSTLTISSSAHPSHSSPCQAWPSACSPLPDFNSTRGHDAHLTDIHWSLQLDGYYILRGDPHVHCRTSPPLA